MVYLSPLKALAVDVHTNLEEPLAEIAEVARELGYEPAPITVAVRTGDSTSYERQMMIRRPPNLLVTTPESLYLYLTAERSRATLANRRDGDRRRDPRPGPRQAGLAPHALARAAPGRDRAPAGPRRPLGDGQAARDGGPPLVGAGEPLPTVVDSGHRRRLDAVAGAARRRARGRPVRRSVRRDPRPHRRPRRQPPNHPGVRQHQKAVREGGPRAGRAARRGPGRRPSRIAVARAPPAGRASPAGRRAAGPRGHRLAGARHRRRAGRAGVPDRLAAQHRHLPPAGGPRQPPPHRRSAGDHVPDHPGRAGRMHGAAGRGRAGTPRCPAPARAAARHPRPADRGRDGGPGRRRRGRGRAVRAVHAGLAVPAAHPRGVRRDRRAGLGRHRDRARPAHGLSTSRPGQRAAACPPGCPAGHPHLGRRDSRDRRLPRADGAGRRVHRHRQRGLRDRVLPGRRVPARHPSVADRAGDQRRHARARRHRQAPDDPVLGRRGAGPHRRAVRGGLPAAERGGGTAR